MVDKMVIELDLPESPGSLTLTLRDPDSSKCTALVRCELVPPLTIPQSPSLSVWEHSREETRESSDLAGMAGTTITDIFSLVDSQVDDMEVASSGAGLNLTLKRQVFTSADTNTVALRQTLINNGPRSIRLQALLPLLCNGSQSLLLNGSGASSWDVCVQKRFKNDGPTSFRPGVDDWDLEMAQHPVGPTGEAKAGEDDEDLTLIRADPCCLLRPRNEPGAAALFLGFLTQTGHLARLEMRFRGGGESVQFERLTAECEFDGVMVRPGECRTSQWLQIAAGPADQLLRDFADRVGLVHDVAPPQGPPPSMLCSFYTYGEYYEERWFEEDLEDLARRPVPFDVFLIDGGWEKARGDWEPREDWWPHGMKAAAERIVETGYRPGIWTAPFVAARHSQLMSKHPDWVLKLDNGEMKEHAPDVWTLDPTYPGVCEFLEETFRKITFEWGYHFHKFDFMRSVFNDPRVCFHDPSATRLEAYRMGLEAIRRGTGPDAYLCVCGGHFGGSLGIAQSQRSGSDVRGWWDGMMKPRIKQNVLRTWMHRLWHVDPDAVLLRRRDVPLIEGPHGQYSLGRLTDDEARVVTLNQYLSGGLVCVAEKFRELDEDRRALLRHILPTMDAPALPLDPLEPVAPSLLVAQVEPQCPGLGRWNTLAVINWDDEPKAIPVVLSDAVTRGMKAQRFLVFELFEQQVLGLFEAGAAVDLGSLPPHSCRQLRIAPWEGDQPVLAGTDMHLSGGGVEIAAWQVTSDREVSGMVETPWDYSVQLTVAFPAGTGFVTGTQTAAGPFTITPRSD